MAKYLIKRLLILIPTLLLIALIVQLLLSFLPSSPGRIILGNNASQQAVDELNEELGYNDPVLQQYGRYIWNACHLDFGESYKYGRPVFDILLPKFPVTVKLAVLSMLLAVLIGLPVGILSAVKQYSAMDRVSTILSLLLASMPSFVFGVLMILAFSLKLGWLPSTGLTSWTGYIMPVLTLALPSAGFFVRLARTMMLETMESEYIETARAKGCPEWRVVLCHGLRNALMPVVTDLGMSLAGLLGGAIIVEQVFGLPGFGSLILSAIQTKDVPMIMGSTIFLSALFMLIMLAVDIIYAFLDPRVALE